jgi:CHASE2 domain-containing sensor protein
MDIHSSVLGPVPGFLLQANYVEALLDDRYLEPVSRWVDYAYGFLLFAGVQLAMLVYQRSVLKALFWASACFAVAVFVLYALVVHVGWYVNPVSVSVLAVAIYGSHLVFERLISLGGERP